MENVTNVNFSIKFFNVIIIIISRLGEMNFNVDKQPTSGNLLNTGQSLVFKVDTDRAAIIPVNMSGGPLSYR